MDCIIDSVRYYENGSMKNAAAIIRGGRLELCAHAPSVSDLPVVKMKNCVALPGLADVHVHLRQPGFSYKETIASGSLAAAAGGFTDVCAMPNLSPVPDCAEALRPELDAIKRDAVINVHPYGALTLGEKGQKMAALDELSPLVCAFSDDGKGIQSADMMLDCMRACARLGRVLAAHCEDESLLRGGYIHDGAYAAAHGHPGICSESEWGPIARDLALAEESGCAYHVCHISTRESVELIRRAKARGVNVTCETAPHYLVFDDSMLQDSGRFRMNPPIRSASDRAALVDGLLDGTIDMIATDHAPHSAEEKSGGLAGSLNGVVGLETSFPVMYTHFVRTGLLSLERLAELMSIAPRRRFGLPLHPGDLTLFELDEEYTLDPADFKSMGRSTPFRGMRLFARCRLTAVGGKIVYDNI